MQGSINQRVWYAIQMEPAIQQTLASKLVNVRALAKYLITRHQWQTSLDAVISSIRRYQTANQELKDGEILKPIFKESIIGTRNNVACITIKELPREVFAKLSGIKFSSLRVTTGTQGVKIVVEQGDVENVTKLFKRSTVKKDLSEISVRVADKAIETKGVLARLAAELSIANINIRELLVCPPEFLIYVLQNDIVKAHDRIMSLTN